MRVLDQLVLAGNSLWSHKRRSVLSLVGMSVAVAAVMLLTSLGDGARRFVEGQFQIIGSNVLGIVPGRVETSGAIPGMGRGARDLTLADGEALRRAVPGVEYVAPFALGNDIVAHGERSRRTLVIGGTSAMLETWNLRVRSGRFLPDRPSKQRGREIVLGAKLARELFVEGSALGATVRVGGWPMQVVGVLAPQGTQMGMDVDETVFVPVASGMRMFDQSSLFRIAVKVRSAGDIEPARRRITQILTERHGEEDFTILTEDAVRDALGSIFDVLTLGLLGIAAISLGVAGVGIMNVMLVTVAEREWEVGLLKSIGAAPRQVLMLFLMEAALLTACGGVLGVASGFGLVQVLGWVAPAFQGRPPYWASPVLGRSRGVPDDRRVGDDLRRAAGASSDAPGSGRGPLGALR